MQIPLRLLTGDQKRSLTSIKKLDEQPLLRMTYYGDYYFDNFLQQGAQNDKDLEIFLNKNFFKMNPINLNFNLGACTIFVVKNDMDEVLFCRNYDFIYTPVLQLFTSPEKGYKSVSTTALTFFGYTKDFLFTGINKDNIHMLATPYIPCDGMNEKGLAVGLLVVPEMSYQKSDLKITLNTTTIVRAILDKASTVKEALELIKQFNVYFSANLYCHYMLADSSGDSALVEYWDDKMQIVTSRDNFQIATNYIACKPINYDEDKYDIDRCNIVKSEIWKNKGILTNEQALGLLVKVGGLIDGADILQWTVIYNLTRKKGRIFTHRDIKNIFDF
ncbi:MAG: linear amide C-N hydrolase [Treponema sp.]|nr:linear amide C-N hydrolase [Treponema sp.]